MSEKRAAKKAAVNPKTPAAAPAIDPLALNARQVTIILIVGFLFGLGVIYEWEPLNGLASITKWEWPWQDLGILQMGLPMLAPFAAIACILWLTDRPRPNIPVAVWLLSIVIASLGLQLISVAADPRGLDRITKIVASPDATAYFTDASHIQNLADWMRRFEHANLTGHSFTHPAGPILFYYAFIGMFGPESGAFWGGCAVGLLASLGSVVMYFFAGLWTSDQRTRLVAAAFYTLIPALTVFFPELDQVYPILSMLIILSFVRSLESESPWHLYALGLGAAAFVATFMAYNLVMLGVFLVYYAIYRLWIVAPGESSQLVNVVRTSALGIAVTAFLYAVLWLATGYNIFAAFGHALSMQKLIAQKLARPYPVLVFTDLYDFVLASGIIAVPILCFYLRTFRVTSLKDQKPIALTLIGLATILTVDISGLLRGETARVWLFLQPLIVIPVAIELARIRLSWRLALFAMQWWILVLVKAKMSFIEP